MQGQLPPEAREKLEELQTLQQKAQQVAIQKQQAEGQLSDARNAVEALDEIDEGAGMYRQVGDLLVETGYDEARDDLEERIDNLEIRVKTLDKQADRVEKQFEKLQGELQEMLGGLGGAGPIGGAGGPGGPGGPGA